MTRKRRILWLLIVGSILLPCIIAYVIPTRPMFQAGRDLRGFWPKWTPALAMADRHGSVAFPDVELNVLVLILTGDPNAHFVRLTFSATPSYAILQKGTPHEVRINRCNDQLIVCSEDGEQRFALPPNVVREWYSDLDLRLIDARPDANLVDEILARYEGDEAEELAEFVSKYRSGKMK